MIRNVTGQETCPWCHDGAQVFVGYSQAGTDQMAPCPKCERGDRLEFARSTQEKGRDGKFHETPRRIPDPWKDGYWQGRPTDGVEAEPDPAPQPLSREQNLKNLKHLTAELAKIGRAI